MSGNYAEIDGNAEWSRTLHRGTTQIPPGRPALTSDAPKWDGHVPNIARDIHVGYFAWIIAIATRSYVHRPHLSCSAPARPAYRAQSPPPSAPSHAPPCAACTRHPAWWSPPPVPPSSHPAPPSPPWHSPPLPPQTARTHTSPPKPDQGRCPGTGGHQEAASQNCPSSAWTLRFSTKRISTLPRLTRSMKTASQASGMWR